MPLNNNATLPEVIQAQNDFIAQQSQKIAALEQNNAQALENLAALGQRVYGYNHESFVIEDIESVYNNIIEANPELENASAIGFTTVLKENDIVPVQGSRMFINGTEETGDYTFSGTNSENGCEYVTVWHFALNNGLNLNNEIELDIMKVIIRNKIEDMTVDKSYYDCSDDLKVEGNFVFNEAARANKITYTFLNSQEKSVFPVKEYVQAGVAALSDYITPVFTDNTTNSEINSKNSVKKIILPDLEIFEKTGGGTSGVNPYTSFFSAEIVCPKLKKIIGSNSNIAPIRLPFGALKKVVVPETVIHIENCCFGHITNLILNCKDALISSIWYSSADLQGWQFTPPTVFEMCSDWGASIDISLVSKNWGKSDYIDLFTNKLRDMTLTDDTRTMKIPTAIYDALTAEEIAVATAKGWTIAHP